MQVFHHSQITIKYYYNLECIIYYSRRSEWRWRGFSVIQPPICNLDGSLFCVSSLTILVPKNPCTETNEKEYSYLQMARFLDFTEYCIFFKPCPQGNTLLLLLPPFHSFLSNRQQLCIKNQCASGLWFKP